MEPNNTDIILNGQEQLTQYGQMPRKIELDDTPDRFTQMQRGVVFWLALPSNPLALVLDSLGWMCGSSLMLLVASVWTPMAILWGVWALSLIIMVAYPSETPQRSVRLCAIIRLLQICIGAVALLVP